MLKKILATVFLVLVIGVSLTFVFGREHDGIAAQKRAPYHEARYYERLPQSQNRVQCFLCPNRCVLSPGQFGRCKARTNIDGTLYALVYGRIATAHVDTIEKKPFFHVLPASRAYSIATTGCNMRCIFCQNWEISQVFPDEVFTRKMTPEDVVREALASGSRSIAFTYSEPVVAYEYMMDIAKLAKERGLKTVVVSSGYIEPEPLQELLQFIDAYKVDFKGFSDRFYRELTGGRLEPVLETMKTIRKSGTWLEVLTLLIPGQNDSPEEIRGLSRWVRENLGTDVPLHFSRFFPQYKLLNLPPTPDETIIRARETAMAEGLKFVYTGNINYPEGEATYCPRSGEKIIERRGYFVVFNHLKEGACSDGEKIPGIWS